MFIDCLRYLVGSNTDIFLGDFNTDGFEEVRSSKEVFCNCNLKVSEPSHLDGTLLDHVNISKSFVSDKYVTSVVKSIYFSYHDAVKVQNKFRQNNQEDIDFNISN